MITKISPNGGELCSNVCVWVTRGAMKVTLLRVCRRISLLSHSPCAGMGQSLESPLLPCVCNRHTPEPSAVWLSLSVSLSQSRQLPVQQQHRYNVCVRLF